MATSIATRKNNSKAPFLLLRRPANMPSARAAMAGTAMNATSRLRKYQSRVVSELARITALPASLVAAVVSVLALIEL